MSEASPFGYGIASAPIHTEVVREFWRHRDRRGHYTKIASRDAEALLAVGPEAVREEVQIAMESPDVVPRGLDLRFDFLELCSGIKSPLMDAIHREPKVMQLRAPSA